MNFSSEQIELITQGVLRELSSRGITVASAAPDSMVGNPSATTVVAPNVTTTNAVGGGTAGGKATSADSKSKVEGATADSSEATRRLNERVITEEFLAAANAAGRSVTVRTDAVITPSGHDFIRRNGVTITRGTGKVVSSATGIVLVVGENAAMLAASTSAGWKVDKAGCEFDAAGKAMSFLGTQPVVCCGGEPSVTACLLNRDGNVRAAVVTMSTDLNRLVRRMNPQAVCLDSHGWSFVDLTKLLRHLAGTSIAVPERWKEIAGGAR